MGLLTPDSRRASKFRHSTYLVAGDAPFPRVRFGMMVIDNAGYR